MKHDNHVGKLLVLTHPDGVNNYHIGLIYQKHENTNGSVTYSVEWNTKVELDRTMNWYYLSDIEYFLQRTEIHLKELKND